MSATGRQTTLHHLFPVSRGAWHGPNHAHIDKLLHYAWHAMTDREEFPQASIPEEIAQDFLDIWWPDHGYSLTLVDGHHAKVLQRRCERVPVSRNALAGKEIVFPGCNPLDMVKLWLWRWVPVDYFTEVEFYQPGLTYIIDPTTVDKRLLRNIDRQQNILLEEAYRRWKSSGHWWRNGAVFVPDSIR